MIHGLSLTSAQRFLCCAISDDEEWHRKSLGELWQYIGDDEAWRIAKENRATSIVSNPLRSILGESELGILWKEAASTVASRLTLYLAEVDRIADALAQRNIELIALKNTGIARGIYPNLAGSPMGDVDVLVKGRDLSVSHEVILGLGFQLDSRNPLGENSLDHAVQSGGAEYTRSLSDGSVLWLELQWRPVSGRWINEVQEPSAEELFARSIPISGSHVRLLSPVDNLLQVSLHTAKHSFVRAPGFRLHTDVDRIVRRCDIDWKEFAEMVERFQVRTAVYFSLWFASELLDTPVPTRVLARLRPTRWRERCIIQMLLKAGLFNPNEHKWGKLGYIIFNLLLYDSFTCVARSVFPSTDWMRRRYAVESGWTLPIWYARRIYDLLFKRVTL